MLLWLNTKGGGGGCRPRQDEKLVDNKRGKGGDGHDVGKSVDRLETTMMTKAFLHFPL